MQLEVFKRKNGHIFSVTSGSLKTIVAVGGAFAEFHTEFVKYMNSFWYICDCSVE